MELSLLIAKILSVLYLSVSLGSFVSRDYYASLLKDLYKNAILTYVMGFMALILGFLIVEYHQPSGKDWTLVIHFFGWAALIKGVLLIALPQYLQKGSQPFLTPKMFKILPYLSLGIGLFFGYFGFFQGKF
jgi:uncharacterized membrane protein HdeD (DUF308 family)